MSLGIMDGYSGATNNLPIEMIKEADQFGVYAMWTAKAYGSEEMSRLKVLMGPCSQRVSRSLICSWGPTKATSLINIEFISF